MKYFIDTEFIERGAHHPIDLISIGVVAEDGREYYAISSEFDPDDASDWVSANVLTQLSPDEWRNAKKLTMIAAEIRSFVGDDKPEFWAYYADYDWVVFCQMFGAMIDLPKGWPMYCRDIKQLCDDLGTPKLPEQGKGEHNALADARWNKLAWAWLKGER